MRTFVAVISTFLLVACDGGFEKLVSSFFDSKDNVVILAKNPVILEPTPATFTSIEPMSVLGEWSSVCLVLRDGVPLDQNSVMDAKFAEALAGSDVNVTVYLTDGSHKSLQPPMVGWRKYGLVLPKDELSACAAAACGSRLPKGSMVAKVEITSRPSLVVKGLYWHSSPDLPQPSKPAAGVQANSCGKNGPA